MTAIAADTIRSGIGRPSGDGRFEDWSDMMVNWPFCRTQIAEQRMRIVDQRWKIGR
jgi:hypothetical protein